jgi:hypothetical protein
MRHNLIRPWATAVLAALVLPLLSVSSSRADGFTPGRDSFYVSDQDLQTISQFKASNGAFQGVLVNASVGGTTGGNFTPTGIVVNPASLPQLLIANQNANTPINGEIGVFPEATGEPKSVLVSASDANAPFAPFGILLYQHELLVADEAGRVEVFDTTTAPATFLQNLDTAGYADANCFSPFGMVVGPHGYLYVATRCGDSGDVTRFNLSTNSFVDVFVSGASCGCDLDHPSGVVFGPDGRLYVASSKPATGAPPDDTDKILIFDGTTGKFIDKIDLDGPGASVRSAAPGLLFGPQGLLYVTITQLDASGMATGVGSVRRYNVASKQYHDLVPPQTYLALPTLFTFGGTNPATLTYEQ